MNATKDTPPATPTDPTRRAFRQWAALWTVAAVALTAALTIPDAVAGATGTELLTHAGRYLVTALSLVAGANMTVMLFAPDMARKAGLPAIGHGDEREYHLSWHAFGTAYGFGFIATMVYGWVLDEPGVSAIGVLMVFVFFVDLVRLNRKV